MSSGCGCVPAIFRREPSKRRQTKKEKYRLAQDTEQQAAHFKSYQDLQEMGDFPESPSKSVNGGQAKVTSSLHIRLKRQRTMSDLDEEDGMDDALNYPSLSELSANLDSSPEIPIPAIVETPDDESSSASTNTGSTTIAVAMKSNVVLDCFSDSCDVSPDNPNAVWSPSCQRKSLKLDLSRFKAPDDETSSPTTGGGTSPANTTSSTTSIRDKWNDEPEEQNPTVWQPFGAPMETPQFRSVKLETPPAKTPPPNIEHSPSSSHQPEKDNPSSPKTAKVVSPKPEKSDISVKLNTQESSGTTTTTTTVTTSWTRTGRTSNLPASQSPTITLLQKAREGQIPRGAIYIDEKQDLKATSPIPKDAILIDQKVTVEGDKIHTDSYYAVPAPLETGEVDSHIIKAVKYDGIGPTEYGIPVGLRTGVKDEYASDWYKTMYRSLHKAPGESRGHTQTVHLGGYMSEPEFDRTDSRKADYASLDYRYRKTDNAPKITRVVSPTNVKRIASPTNVRRVPSPTNAKTPAQIDKIAEEYLTGVSSRHSEPYKNQPRSIAEYEPGHSSLAEREFQKFWDDFWDSLDDLHEHFKLSPRPQHQHFSEKKWPNAILCDGYESDSTLIRKSGRPPPRIDPGQQKAWYKEIQKGGEIPLTGLRKLAPERPKESQHQYQETEVNIHFKSPIRNLEKEYIEEEELRKRQEDAMRKFYAEERQKKQLREAAELEMRRHCDFFTPSQKSPIPLNRYDNPFESNYISKCVSPSSDHPRTLAQVIYPFVAQSTRELSLNKGDIVYINKQIDRNWYEGEHHGFVGIFPVSYVMVIPTERANLQPRKASEGHGIVKYTFRAKTSMELSLFKGERVVLMRRVDRNWYDGRVGAKRGIFPVNYIEVFQEPGDTSIRVDCAISPKPPASPVYSPMVNGSPPKPSSGPTYVSGAISVNGNKLTEKSSVTQSLHVDTYNEPIPYRSLYSYHPQNEDELELREGDTVYVMEKCDDGWYVGTSLRSGLFGTFPGNYVERI